MSTRPSQAIEEPNNTAGGLVTQKKAAPILAVNIAERFDGSTKDLLEEE